MTISTEKTQSWVSQDIEQFLYREAALLDDWKLDEWLALFTDDCAYIIPSTDKPWGSPKDTLVFVDDNRIRLEGRVRRLKNKTAHREFPHSRTRHFVSNVLLAAETPTGDAKVQANFQVYRFKEGSTEPFIGTYRYVLTRLDGEIRIRRKYAILDLENLRGQGAVSIIL
ncbi:aromatic-ring-hydroxylating dioxygenase subunit beta [Novosphingobium sp. KN65.2]|uniref:aromatic-ring-hydroxylating dioxygenase subunit beta n=1 Tax=Novosphingobium sp. KN65.2 TaxID=1478134 RepID=UPI0005E8367C|nr:aromatic-ring-hydroxylating dioxygenase subunit beta [Novosphingobium sp. KN65.2]CDO34097.1 P-cumate dioxygenase small subunit [Novosphingobium sp. KN65.2]